MKLHLARTESQNTFTGYGEDYVLVNARRYERSLIVLPDKVIEGWEVASVGALRPDHISLFAELNAEIILLGTGNRLQFPDPRLIEPLGLARIGIEVMDTRAACRTYNVLLAEGRNIAAALIL